MNHERVQSSNVHSIAHQGETMEVRFNCPQCHGEGIIGVNFDLAPIKCLPCHGTGHTGTYRYVGVPKALHDRVMAGDHGFREKPASVGVAFNALVRPQFKAEKL